MKEMSDVKLGMHILELEITTRCNLNCKHCYNRNYTTLDMPLENIKKFYDFANKFSVRNFIISGGEALLYPKFKELVNFIKHSRRFFRLVLQTNGTLINKNKYNILKTFDVIHISYDPVENIRLNSSKNLQLAIDLKNNGIKSYLFCTIHKNNYHLIDEIVKDANQSKIDIGFNVCVSTNKLNDNHLFSKKEFFEIEKKLYYLSKKRKILRFSSPLVAVFDKSHAGKFEKIKGGCTAGISSCVIDSKLNVLPCPFFRIKAGNTSKESLEEIWFKSLLFSVLRNRKKFDKPCCSCEFLSYCGGCRCRAYKKTGKLNACDPNCYKKQALKSNELN